MPGSFAEAVTDILTVVNTAWATTTFDIFWPNTPGAPTADDPGGSPIGPVPFARATLVHAPGTQAAGVANGERLFGRQGTLSVQVFGIAAEGLSRSYALAKIIADACEGADTPVGVWFRNLRLNEIGVTGVYYQINVVVDFRYDEIK